MCWSFPPTNHPGLTENPPAVFLVKAFMRSIMQNDTFYIQSQSWSLVFSVIYCFGRSCHLPSWVLLSPNKTLDYKSLTVWTSVAQCYTPALCKSNSTLHLTNLFSVPVYHLTWKRRGDLKEVDVTKLMANSWRALTHHISQNSQPALVSYHPALRHPVSHKSQLPVTTGFYVQDSNGVSCCFHQCSF